MAKPNGEKIMNDDELKIQPGNQVVSEGASLTLEEMRNVIVEVIDNLPEQEKLVIALYYYEELTFKEIGQILDISESRVCQIHSQVIKELRQQLHEYENA